VRGVRSSFCSPRSKNISNFYTKNNVVSKMGTEPEKGGHSSSLSNNDTNVNPIENNICRESVDHGRECRAWFNSLKPDDKACATASANARFIRMFLNLSKRMDSRTVNGNAGKNFFTYLINSAS